MAPDPRSRRGIIAQSGPVVKEPGGSANGVVGAGAASPGGAARPQPLPAFLAALNSSAVIALIVRSSIKTWPPLSGAFFS